MPNDTDYHRIVFNTLDEMESFQEAAESQIGDAEVTRTGDQLQLEVWAPHKRLDKIKALAVAFEGAIQP